MGLPQLRNRPEQTVVLLQKWAIEKWGGQPSLHEPRAPQYAKLARLSEASVEQLSMLSLAYEAVTSDHWARYVPPHLRHEVAGEYVEAASLDPFIWQEGRRSCLARGTRCAPGLGTEAAYRFLLADLALQCFVEQVWPEQIRDLCAWLEVWKARHIPGRCASS